MAYARKHMPAKRKHEPLKSNWTAPLHLKIEAEDKIRQRRSTTLTYLQRKKNCKILKTDHQYALVKRHTYKLLNTIFIEKRCVCGKKKFEFMSI